MIFIINQRKCIVNILYDNSDDIFDAHFLILDCCSLMKSSTKGGPFYLIYSRNQSKSAFLRLVKRSSTASSQASCSMSMLILTSNLFSLLIASFPRFLFPTSQQSSPMVMTGTCGFFSLTSCQTFCHFFSWSLSLLFAASYEYALNTIEKQACSGNL